MNLPGVNIQAPWAELIASGKKTVETRFYGLPLKYLGKPMALIETPGPRGTFKKRVIAIVTFSKSFEYPSAVAFYKDAKKHLITKASSDFGWDSGSGKRKWGWQVASVKRLKSPIPVTVRTGILFTKSVPVPNLQDS